jgi:FAD/FMN-containing dehydrogenase
MMERRLVNLAGRVLPESTVGSFVRSLHGKVIRPADGDYDEARMVWNGMIDRHPAMITYCRDIDDVMNCVNFARSNELLAAVRSGGHNVAGNAVCDGGLVIDLSKMKAIRVDVESRTARVQAGLNLGEFDRATQTHGLATTMGIVSRTGLAGLTLGGGIGWLMRKFGTTCDNLLSASIVTADGRLVIARDDENQDLFWGVRGGGGNFGIVTEFEFRLHEVGRVLAGTVYYHAKRTREILRFYRDYISGIPDGLTTMFAYIAASPELPLRKLFHGTPVAAIHVCYTGNIEAGEKVVKPLREFGPPLGDTLRIMPYVELQSMLDPGSPPGHRNYWKSAYLKNLSDEAIEVLSAYCDELTSPLSQVHLQHMQGEVSRVDEADMAFSHRDALCVLNIVTKWKSPHESEKHIEWTRAFASAMKPYSAGVYVNFLGEEGEDRVKEAYIPSKYNRLAALKSKYDPSNLFRLNQNIMPN